MTSDLFTIRALLEASAACNPDRVAVSDGVASITFAELHDAALRSGTALRRLGVRRGDRIGICMEKGIEQAIAILGSLVADAIVVPVLPTLKSINIEHIVRNSEMRLMITDEVRSPQVIGAAPDIPLLIADGAPAASDRSLRALREA